MSYPPDYSQPPYPPRPSRKGKRGRRVPTPPYSQPGVPPLLDYSAGPAYPPAGQPSYEVPRRRRRGRQGCTIGPGCIFGCIGMVGVMVLGFLITAFVIYDYYSGKLEDEVANLKTLENYQSFETTVIYDRHGNKLYEVLGEGRRTRIPIDQIPQNLIDATISVEDDTFYENRGIDLPSIARAGWQYVRYGYIVSGGSTITQQLIRNVLFTQEYRNQQSLNRKLDEALLAVILTQRMSKNEILELYLNEIYYGNLAYGIEAASQTFFGKHASELTLGEAALLAGLPQAPADLDPLNPDPSIQQRVMERRRLVLDLMVKHGSITRAEADAAYAEPLVFISPDIQLDSAPHLVVYSQVELERLLVQQLGQSEEDVRRLIARGGLQVYTSVDMDYQHLAENVARQQVATLKAAHNMNNAAVVIVRPDTGEILAMVGSINYEDEAIDGNVNVTIAARQPGSSIKPFTYASAMEKGLTAASIIWDTETHIGPPGVEYSPVNYDGSFHGPVRMREALANSYNIPAVQTLRQVGVEYLLWMMNRVGVTSLSNDPSLYGLSLTLGGGEVTPLELTTAYAVLANGGVYVPNTSIVCVTDSAGKIIYEYEDRCPASATLTDKSISVSAAGQQVLDPRIAFVLSSILSDNDARTPAMGANSPLYTPGLPTSVKTGTTNDYKDNWTVGYTRNIAIGVWAGNTDNTAMISVSGLDGAAPIWHDLMTGIYGNPALLDVLGTRQPDDAHLQAPGGVYARQICSISRGMLKDPATSCSPGITEWFLDSPASVPDNNGNLVPVAPSPVPPASANGPQITEVEPGLVRTYVFPIQTDLANAIVQADPTNHTVPPKYCLVPVEVAGQIPGVAEQLFIQPPPIDDDAFYARVWAQANGVAILPQFACNEQMLSAQPVVSGGGSGSVPAGVTAYISSPTPGQTVPAGSALNVVGTASWSPGQAQFFKVEIMGGPFGSWTTLGDVSSWPNNSGVADGTLASIMGGVLSPGNYMLQLVIVAPDGNILTTQQTSFNVG